MAANNVGVPVPPKAYMHKPRSQKTDGGFMSRFRGAGEWQRRCVYIENHAINYGEGTEDKLKIIPLEKITNVDKIPREKLLKEKSVAHFADNGWSFSYESKLVEFACETPEVRDAWLSYLQAFLEAMKTFSSGGGGGGGGNNNNDDDPSSPTFNGGSGSGGGGATLASMANNATNGELAHVPGANLNAAFDDDEDGSPGGGGGRRVNRDQLKQLMGEGDDDDALDMDALEGLDDDDDDDDEDSDMEDDDGSGSATKKSKKAARQALFDAPRLQFERQLKQIASKPYNHIAFKLDKYANHFKDGDSLKEIVFSRSVYKVSKKNNNYDRDLVLTKTHLYLFSVGGILSTVSVKAIDLDQIVGVVESTETRSLFALLVPGWHDVLLKIAPQNSVLGGDEEQAKAQLIAHLFTILQKLCPGRQFIFREAANVPSIIRRSEDDQHQPLRSEENDKMRIASKPDLYPKFRVQAETVVYLSCHVQRVNAEMSYSPRIFVVTDGGIYLVHTDAERISKRASLNDVILMKCDSEMHGILLQMPEIDWVVFATTLADYQAIVRYVPDAAMRSCRHKVQIQSSRNLLNGNPRLQDAKGLMEKFSAAGASTEDTLRAISKLALRAGKASWKFSKSGLSLITKNVENVTKGSVDLLTKGAQEFGGLLLDNAITGELLGLGEQMLSITGAVSARVVSERIHKLSDVDKRCSLKEPTTDSLKMVGTPALQSFAQTHKDIDCSIIFFTARCKQLPIAASVVGDNSRSSDRFIVLTSTGILLFDDISGSSGSVVTGSKTLLTRAFKTLTGGQMGLQLHEVIKWSETRGVIRCLGEPNLIGILNNTSAVSTLRDVLIRLPNSKLADTFEAHFLNLHAAALTPKEGRGYWKVLAGDFATPTPDHLRHALKGTALQQDPTTALRLHPLGGDDLKIAVDQIIIDRIRKYGDNCVRFSSLAWRLKTSTVRKDPNQALKAANEQTTEAGSHGAGLDKKLFKQCGLVLTNCAVYQFEDGSKQINRRLELYEISRIKINNADPDAVLLVVPREFDFFIRIEGRAQEFIDKLVEARNEWTNFELELPIELDNESFLPLPLKDKAKEVAQAKRQVPIPIDAITIPVFNVGRLVKPKSFSEEQAQILAEDVHNSYVRKLMKFVADALEEVDIPRIGGGGNNNHHSSHGGFVNNASLDFSNAPAGTNNFGRDSENDLVALGNANAQQSMYTGPISTGDGGTDTILHFERAMAQVRFAVERAFNFGLRPQMDACADLARGLTLIEFHKRWKEILQRLQRASQADALDDFTQAESDARSLRHAIEQKFMGKLCAVSNSFEEAISTTIELQSPQLDAMRSRSHIKQQIETLITRASANGPEGVLADLEEAVVRAADLGVSGEILDGFRLSFDSAVQAYRMQRIAAYSWSPPLIDIFNEALSTVVSSTSSSTNLQQQQQQLATIVVVKSQTDHQQQQDFMTTWAIRTLDAAVNNGDLMQLEAEIKAVSIAFSGANNDGVMPQRVEEAVNRAKELMSLLQRYDSTIQDLKRIASDFRRRVAQLTCDQLLSFEEEFARIIEQLPANVPSIRASRDTALVLFQTVQLKRKTAELQEEAILEEKALAAAYSKSANEDAIASAQRYERAQRAKLELQMHQRKKDIEEISERASQLLFEMKRRVAAEDSDNVGTLTNSIDGLSAQMETMLSRCASQKEVRDLEASIVDLFRQRLDEARLLGETFLDQFARRGGAAAIPPEAITAAQRLDAEALCRYVESGELDIASLKLLGEIWQKSAEQKKSLHRLRQRAFVIDHTDEAAVASLISEATSIGVENDPVIAKVRETANKAKKQKKQQQLSLNSNSNNHDENKHHQQQQQQHDQQNQHSKTSSTTKDPQQQQHQAQQPQAKKFIPPAIYDPQYYWVSCKGGGIFLDVHGALERILRKEGVVDSIKESGRYELPKDIFTSDIRDFCTRLENFLNHRVKPAGFFRKTQRSLFDLITEVGKVSRGGDIIAPFCAHLIGEFERVKKLNNANGLTSDQVLVRLLLSKRDLQKVFDDFGKLNAKERENLFFEDSVWLINDDIATKDMNLFAKMCAQIVWPFNFTDRKSHFDLTASSSSVLLGSTAASLAGSPNATQASFRQGGSGGGNGGLLTSDALAAIPSLNNASIAGTDRGDNASVAVSTVAPAGSFNPKDMISGEQALSALRHAVRIFSSFFQTEMRELGIDSTPEQRRAIFDETKTKMCGVMVRDELCAAISLLFRSGLKPLTGLMSRFQKRHPWDIVAACTERMRQSAHGLSGIALPEAHDTVMSLTDPAMLSGGSRNKGVSAVSKMNDEQLRDVRFRIFICYCLNRKILSSLILNAIFDPRSQSEFLNSKFYTAGQCALQDDEHRGEIGKLFGYFEKLPFVLSLDAEIW